MILCNYRPFLRHFNSTRYTVLRGAKDPSGPVRGKRNFLGMLRRNCNCFRYVNDGNRDTIQRSRRIPGKELPEEEKWLAGMAAANRIPNVPFPLSPSGSEIRADKKLINIKRINKKTDPGQSINIHMPISGNM